MKALPAGHFTVCDYKYFLRVPDNYHLECDGHYCSVAYTMHGKPALLKAAMSEIRICDENNRLLSLLLDVQISYLTKKHAEEQHYNIALSHAAKKLVRVIYAMEKSKRPYNSPA